MNMMKASAQNPEQTTEQIAIEGRVQGMIEEGDRRVEDLLDETHNMQKLNIPLSRSSKTTRRPRWVVWLFIVLLAFTVFLADLLSSLWFTRASLLQAAPVGTNIAIIFTANKKTLPVIEDLLYTTPLISNRALTLHDLAPSIHGQFALFINQDGHRSIAFRSKKADVPIEMIEAHKIVIQEVGSSTVLLSEKLVAIDEMIKTPRIRRGLPSGNQFVAEVFLTEKDSSLLLFSQDEELLLSTKTKDDTEPLQRPLPANTIAHLQLPAKTEDIENILHQALYQWIEPLHTDSSKKLFQQLFTNPGLIVLANNQESLDILAEFYQPLTQEQVFSILSSISSIQSVQLKSRNLQDGTTMREFTVDPDAQTIEKRTIMGKEVFSARSKSDQEYFFSVSNTTLFSTNQYLLESWLNNEENEDVLTICDANISGLSLLELIAMDIDQRHVYQQSYINRFVERFPKIGLFTLNNTFMLKTCR